MRTNQTKALVLLWITCLASAVSIPGSFAQFTGDNQVAKKLENTLPGMLDSAGIPGLSIALVHGKKIIWRKGYGVSNRETKKAVTPQTVFQGASMGKPVFAYAVLKLCDQGKFNLDTPLSQYIPQAYLEEHFLKGPLTDERIRSITARMVLSHTTGFPNWRPEGEPIKIHFTPGSRYSNSGEGFVYLQRVIEYITQEPVERFMQRTVFKPLRMRQSGYVTRDTLQQATAYGADGQPQAVKLNEPANVAYTFRTTAPDYARFLIAMMRGTGLERKTHEDMLSKQISTEIGSQGKVSWGLGVAIQHAGTADGFSLWGKSPSASAYAIGFRGTAIVYFTNIAMQGLTISEAIGQVGLNHYDPTFSHYHVRSYNAKAEHPKQAN